MPRSEDVELGIAERKALALNAQPTTLRRCLGCDVWMHSTGADHRMCNSCRGFSPSKDTHVGRRIR